MKKIIVSRKHNIYALIDSADFKKVNKYNWYVFSTGKASKKQYVYTTINNKEWLYLHRYIMDAEKGKEVDHKNGNTLDNRKSNLRICNRKQQARNTSVRKNSEIAYKGVSLSKDKKRNKKYRARIRINDKNIMLGRYLTAKEAAIMYDRAALKYYGEFARTNFNYLDNKGLKFKLERNCNY